MHLNVRFFAARRAGRTGGWFGGGMDLTPYYGFEEDVRAFAPRDRERSRRSATTLYPRFKRWCDEYFFLKHRDEPRGIGGVFFDDLAEGGFAACFALMRAVGDASCRPTCRSSSAAGTLPYGERERAFQSTAAAATSSSTWSTTAARCSACSRAAAPRAS